MRVNVHTSGIECDGSTREWVKSKVLSALSRVQHSLQLVDVKLTDQKGPKGGKDIQCLLLLRSERLDDIVIKDVESEFSQALSRALERGRRTLIRRLKQLKPDYA